MTLRTRRIFFWALIPIFLVGGAAAVLYSQGYRFDFQTHAVTKIGALYVRGYPKSASITLDGEALNTGSWWPLSSGTLDGSLVPGTYKLHAEAPGYQTWDADVVIRPALVTERKSLVLFPDKTMPVPMPTGTVLAALDAPDSFDEPVLVTTPDNPRAIVGKAVIPGTYLGTTRGRLALVSTVRRGKTTGQILTLQAPDDAAATTVSLQGQASEDPRVMDDSVLHRENTHLVAAYDGATGRREVFASSTEKEAIGTYLRTRGFDAWEVRTATGTMLAIQRRNTSNRTQIPSRKIVSLQPSGSSIGVLDELGSLWLINPENGSRQEVGHRAKLASWKDDGTAVAAVIDGVVEVIPLEKEAPHGKLLGAVAQADTVRSIAWYPDGEHVFIETAGELVFADVINGKIGEQHTYRMSLPAAWAYSAKQGMLYVLDKGVQGYVFPD